MIFIRGFGVVSVNGANRVHLPAASMIAFIVHNKKIVEQILSNYFFCTSFIYITPPVYFRILLIRPFVLRYLSWLIITSVLFWNISIVISIPQSVFIFSILLHWSGVIFLFKVSFVSMFHINNTIIFYKITINNILSNK